MHVIRCLIITMLFSFFIENWRLIWNWNYICVEDNFHFILIYIYVNCMGFFRKNKYLKPYFLEKASTFQICLTRKSKRYKQAWKVYIKGFKTLKQIVNLHILSILLLHLHIYIYIYGIHFICKKWWPVQEWKRSKTSEKWVIVISYTSFV